MIRITLLPIQFWCITHEMAVGATETTHIAEELFPYKVYWVIGRSAKIAPRCDVSHCLFYTWKDWVGFELNHGGTGA